VGGASVAKTLAVLGSGSQAGDVGGFLPQAGLPVVVGCHFMLPQRLRVGSAKAGCVPEAISPAVDESSSAEQERVVLWLSARSSCILQTPRALVDGNGLE
jgi:hypothetical protein